MLGTPPESTKKPAEAVAQRALEGLTRAMGKEIGRGATVQLVYVEPGAEDQIAGTLRFFLSPRSAFVSVQVVRIGRVSLSANRVLTKGTNQRPISFSSI